MICVTIVQESRRLALADMLNAAMLGADMVEVRLDKFDKDANLTELVNARKKPVLFSCRRPKDGGEWNGAEDERLTLLRSAVVAKADYVEMELDVADQIRPFPGCKRVVSYTNLSGTPKDISDIYAQLLTKSPDVVKITCQADSPEEAWPLLTLLNKPPVPTVVEARGRAGLMVSLVGRKVGAPWAAAAIERGQEAYPGQPTIRDLTDIYRYADVEKRTKFVGVVGEGEERARLAAGLFNAAFAHAGQPQRALPVDIYSRRMFIKVAEAIRMQSVLLVPPRYEGMHEVAKLDESARAPVLGADGLAPGEGEWVAFNALGQATVNAVQAALRERDGDASLKGRVVALAGVGTLTRMIAPAFKAAGSALLWASRDKAAVQSASQSFGGRQVLWEAIYATSHDVLVIGQDASKAPEADLPFHPGYLRPGMVVIDMTAEVRPSRFLGEAEKRGCMIVTPGRLLVEQVREHSRRLGTEVPADVLNEKLTSWLPED